MADENKTGDTRSAYVGFDPDREKANKEYYGLTDSANPGSNPGDSPAEESENSETSPAEEVIDEESQTELQNETEEQEEQEQESEPSPEEEEQVEPESPPEEERKIDPAKDKIKKTVPDRNLKIALHQEREAKKILKKRIEALELAAVKANEPKDSDLEFDFDEESPNAEILKPVVDVIKDLRKEVHELKVGSKQNKIELEQSHQEAAARSEREQQSELITKAVEVLNKEGVPGFLELNGVNEFLFHLQNKHGFDKPSNSFTNLEAARAENTVEGIVAFWKNRLPQKAEILNSFNKNALFAKKNELKKKAGLISKSGAPIASKKTTKGTDREEYIKKRLKFQIT